MRVVVGGKAYEVRPAEALRLDGAATEQALWDAGRTSFTGRMRTARRPEPADAGRRPVLVARPEARGGRRASLRRAAEAAPRAGGRPQRLRVIPSRPGDAVDATPAGRASLAKASLTGVRTLSPALTHVEPELTTVGRGSRGRGGESLVDEPVTLAFKGEDVGSLPPDAAREAAPLPPRRRSLPHLVPSAARRQGGRADARAVAGPRGQRPLRRRREERARSALASRVSPSTARWAADSIAAAAAAPVHRASLRLKQIRADLTTREAERLGIRQQISTFTTDMGTSSSNRIHNVQLMAQYIDGTVIKPGDTFSFNDRVGPRTVERGFREGQMIIGSLLLPAIGGGVCQTATTLFNNAFELGLPIVERHNHSFYISHYPMGRDATVSWGGPDFVFRNDLKTGILIKTRYTNSTLTFSFYGTDPGRRVVTSTSERTNWRTPKTTYALDPYAPRGSVRTVAGSNQAGFDVTVTRKVYEHGKLLRQDATASAYIAVGPTAIYGPGRSIPGPYFVLPRV